MKLQYIAPSVRANIRHDGRRNGWKQESAVDIYGDDFTGSLRESVRLALHPIVVKRLIQMGAVIACGALLCNLSCSFMISSAEQEMATLTKEKVALETANITLLAKRAMAWGPDSMKKLVGEKLDLAPASKGQVGVFDRRRGLFRY